MVRRGKGGPSAPQNIAIGGSSTAFPPEGQLPQTPVSASANSGSFESVYSVRYLEGEVELTPAG